MSDTFFLFVSFLLYPRVSFRRKKKDEKDAKAPKEDAKPAPEPKKAATKEEKKVSQPLLRRISLILKFRCSSND